VRRLSDSDCGRGVEGGGPGGWRTWAPVGRPCAGPGRSGPLRASWVLGCGRGASFFLSVLSAGRRAAGPSVAVPVRSAWTLDRTLGAEQTGSCPSPSRGSSGLGWAGAA
jgi:hypothetical protein